MFFRSFRQVAWIAALCAVASPRLGAQAAHGRVPVSSQQVVQALKSAGVDASPSQVRLLANVTSNEGATLRVKNMKGLSNGILAEVVCRNPSQCIPFYAVIHFDDAHSDEAAAFVKSAVFRPAAAPETPPLIARGQAVTLLIQDSDFRIVLPAVCLENGVSGQIIRVTSPDRKRIYTAEVISNKLVRSTL
jgi:hypothetical protein